jgi:thiol:disulfide interchange protein
MKRPPTIWLNQAIFGLLLLFAFLTNFVVLLTHLGEEFSIVRTLLVYSMMLGVVLLLAIAFWGLARRKNYGRWLGILSLLLFWGLLILMKLWRPSGPYQYYEYENPAQTRWSRYCPGSSAWINLVLNTSLIIL